MGANLPVYNISQLPLSLQESCYICLVGHLDHYHPDLISLLPTSLRHQLLLRLPAIDLHRLENTLATENFDMTHYWKALYNRFGFNYSFISTPETTNFKDRFLNEVIECIPLSLKCRLHSAKPRFDRTNYLTHPKLLHRFTCLPYWFSLDNQQSEPPHYVKSTASTYGLKYIGSQYNYIFPYCFESLYIDNPWIEWKAHVMTSIKILSECFHTCSNLIHYECHDLTSFLNCDKDFILKFFAGAQSIKLTCSSPICRSSQPVHLAEHDPSDIFSLILSAKNPTLRKIKAPDFSAECHNITPFIIHQFLQSLVRFFAPGFGSPTSLPVFIPYKGLVELEFSCLSDTVNKVNPLKHEYPLYQLAAIIDNQENLRSVNLQGVFTPTPGCDSLMIALANFTRKCTYETLSIKGVNTKREYSTNMTINSDAAVQLFVNFLTSPTTHEQSLLISNVNFIGECRIPQSLLSLLPPETQKHKILTLDGVGLGKQMVFVLSQVPPICLKMLKLYLSTSFSTLSNLHNLTATELILDLYIIDKIEMEIGKVLAPFILNKEIEKLSIHFEEETNWSHLASIGRVISKHAKTFKTLQFVTVNTNVSMVTQFSDINTFYNSLVDLAQVVPLELGLCTLGEQLQILRKIYSNRKSIRKIPVLVCYSRFGYDTPVKDIAENVVVNKNVSFGDIDSI